MQKIICRKEESMNIKIAVIDNDRNYLNRLFAVLKQYSELTIFILKKQKMYETQTLCRRSPPL